MDTILQFDDQLPGTIIKTQYQASGIIFDEAIIAADVIAPSPRNALHPTQSEGPIEFPKYYIIGRFTDPRHSHVGLWVGTTNVVDGGATLTIYDAAGRVLDEILIRVEPGNRYVYGELFSGNANIASFEVKGYRDNFDGVDNLIFDDLTSVQEPDFRLGYSGVGIGLDPITGRQYGAPDDQYVNITRLYGSVGNITLQAVGLPPGIKLDFEPNPFTSNNSGLVRLNFTVDQNAVPQQNLLIQVMGVGEASAGSQKRQVTIPLTILDIYDAKIIGIEVTQGIQEYNLPVPSGPFADNPNETGIVSYQGQVGLAAGKLTKARVFPVIRQQPIHAQLPNFDCFLYGFDQHNRQLSGSPLSPDFGVSVPIGDVKQVTDNMRTNPLTGAIFTLPPEWTHGRITLRAELRPAHSLGRTGIIDPFPNNNIFWLGNIAFTPTQELYIAGFALFVQSIDDGYVDPPIIAFDQAKNLLPIGDHQFHTSDFDGWIDITDIYNFPLPINDISRGELCAARLRDFADDMNYTESGELVYGLYPGQAGSQIRGLENRNCTGPFWDCDKLSVAVAQSSGRPLSAVAHELGHMLGRKHASGACGAADPEDWPPDQQGYIQGVGTDCHTSPQSMRILLQPFFNQQAPIDFGGFLYYDFMGYCGMNGSNDPDKWISVRGWNETLSTLAAGTPGTLLQPMLLSASTNNQQIRSFTPAVTRGIGGIPTAIVLHALVSLSGEIQLTKIAPVSGREPDMAVESSYEFFILDRDGRLLQQGFAHESPFTSFRAGRSVFLEAILPVSDWSEVAAVELHHNGEVVARQERASHPPQIGNIIVEPDIWNNGKPVTTIRWQTLHPQQLALITKIDSSWDGGCTWRTLYFGPDRGVVSLPSSLFQASSESLVRVRISDGFNEVHACSELFCAEGTPPLVRILQPTNCQRIRCGATVYLHGEAFDDRRHPIPDRNIDWFVDQHRLASGRTASVKMKSHGSMILTLRATDYQGRSSEQHIHILGCAD